VKVFYLVLALLLAAGTADAAQHGKQRGKAHP